MGDVDVEAEFGKWNRVLPEADPVRRRSLAKKVVHDLSRMTGLKVPEVWVGMADPGEGNAGVCTYDLGDEKANLDWIQRYNRNDTLGSLSDTVVHEVVHAMINRNNSYVREAFEHLDAGDARDPKSIRWRCEIKAFHEFVATYFGFQLGRSGDNPLGIDPEMLRMKVSSLFLLDVRKIGVIQRNNQNFLGQMVDTSYEEYGKDFGVLLNTSRVDMDPRALLMMSPQEYMGLLERLEFDQKTTQEAADYFAGEIKKLPSYKANVREGKKRGVV